MRHLNYIEMTARRRDHHGHLHDVKIDRSPLPSNFWLYFGNDLHLGNEAASIASFEKFVKDVRSKRTSYVVEQGDMLETISHYDKRFSLDVHNTLMSRLEAQRDAFIELTQPIRWRYLWELEGNHEGKVRNTWRVMRDVAASHPGSMYANGRVVKAFFSGFRLMSVHGFGRVRSKAGDALQRATNELIILKRHLRELPLDDCEIVTCGHYHNLWIHPPVSKQVLVSDPKKNRLEHHYTEPGRIWIDEKRDLYRIPEDERYYVCCGSFLRSYMEDMPTYPEDMGLRPTELGYVRIQVKNDKLHKVEAIKIPARE